MGCFWHWHWNYFRLESNSSRWICHAWIRYASQSADKIKCCATRYFLLSLTCWGLIKDFRLRSTICTLSPREKKFFRARRENIGEKHPSVLPDSPRFSDFHVTAQCCVCERKHSWERKIHRKHQLSPQMRSCRARHWKRFSCASLTIFTQWEEEAKSFLQILFCEKDFFVFSRKNFCCFVSALDETGKYKVN